MGVLFSGGKETPGEDRVSHYCESVMWTSSTTVLPVCKGVGCVPVTNPVMKRPYIVNSERFYVGSPFNLIMTLLDPNHRPDRPPDTPQKDVMHCPECQYSDPLQEWDFTMINGDEVLQCPDCQAVIDNRTPTTAGSKGTSCGTDTPRSHTELHCDD